MGIEGLALFPHTARRGDSEIAIRVVVLRDPTHVLREDDLFTERTLGLETKQDGPGF